MIGLIFNGNAGKTKIGKVEKKKLERILNSNGVVRESANKSGLIEIIREFKESNVDKIVLVGGDGTLHYATNCLANIYDNKMPLIIPLNGGTTNVISKSIDCGENPTRTLQAIIECEKNNINIKTIDIYPIYVTNAENKINVYSFIFGQGAVWKFMEEYYDSPGEPTPWKATKLFLKAAVDSRYREEFFNCDELAAIVPRNKSFKGSNYEVCNILFASSVKAVIKTLGFRLDPFNVLESGGMYLGYCNFKPSIGNFFSLVWNATNGREINGVKYHNNVDEFYVQSTNEGNNFAADGEMIEAKSNLIKVRRADFSFRFATEI